MDVIGIILVWTTFLHDTCVNWIERLPDAASSFTRTIGMGPTYPDVAITQPPVTFSFPTYTTASTPESLISPFANATFNDSLREAAGPHLEYGEPPLALGVEFSFDFLVLIVPVLAVLLLYGLVKCSCRLVHALVPSILGQMLQHAQSSLHASEAVPYTRLRWYLDSISTGVLYQPDPEHTTRSQADFLDLELFRVCLEHPRDDWSSDERIRNLEKELETERSRHSIRESALQREVKKLKGQLETTRDHLDSAQQKLAPVYSNLGAHIRLRQIKEGRRFESDGGNIPSVSDISQAQIKTPDTRQASLSQGSDQHDGSRPFDGQVPNATADQNGPDHSVPATTGSQVEARGTAERPARLDAQRVSQLEEDGLSDGPLKASDNMDSLSGKQAFGGRTIWEDDIGRLSASQTPQDVVSRMPESQANSDARGVTQVEVATSPDATEELSNIKDSFETDAVASSKKQALDRFTSLEDPSSVLPELPNPQEDGSRRLDSRKDSGAQGSATSDLPASDVDRASNSVSPRPQVPDSEITRTSEPSTQSYTPGSNQAESSASTDPSTRALDDGQQQPQQQVLQQGCDIPSAPALKFSTSESVGQHIGTLFQTPEQTFSMLATRQASGTGLISFGDISTISDSPMPDIAPTAVSAQVANENQSPTPLQSAGSQQEGSLSSPSTSPLAGESSLGSAQRIDGPPNDKLKDIDMEDSSGAEDTIIQNPGKAEDAQDMDMEDSGEEQDTDIDNPSEAEDAQDADMENAGEAPQESLVGVEDFTMSSASEGDESDLVCDECHKQLGEGAGMGGFCDDCFTGSASAQQSQAPPSSSPVIPDPPSAAKLDDVQEPASVISNTEWQPSQSQKEDNKSSASQPIMQQPIAMQQPTAMQLPTAMQQPTAMQLPAVMPLPTTQDWDSDDRPQQASEEVMRTRSVHKLRGGRFVRGVNSGLTLSQSSPGPTVASASTPMQPARPSPSTLGDADVVIEELNFKCPECGEPCAWLLDGNVCSPRCNDTQASRQAANQASASTQVANQAVPTQAHTGSPSRGSATQPLSPRSGRDDEDDDHGSLDEDDDASDDSDPFGGMSRHHRKSVKTQSNEGARNSRTSWRSNHNSRATSSEVSNPSQSQPPNDEGSKCSICKRTVGGWEVICKKCAAPPAGQKSKDDKPDDNDHGDSDSHDGSAPTKPSQNTSSTTGNTMKASQESPSPADPSAGEQQDKPDGKKGTDDLDSNGGSGPSDFGHSTSSATYSTANAPQEPPLLAGLPVSGPALGQGGPAPTTPASEGSSSPAPAVNQGPRKKVPEGASYEKLPNVKKLDSEAKKKALSVLSGKSNRRLRPVVQRNDHTPKCAQCEKPSGPQC